MPISQGNLSFNTGRDTTVVLVGPSGRIQIDNVMTFDAKQEVAKIQVDRLDGQMMNAALPKGWTGTITLERNNSSVDNAIAQIEANWIDLGNYGVSTIYQYINNADGSQVTYQYDNAAIVLENAGEWKGDASVKQTISFTANRRRAV